MDKVKELKNVLDWFILANIQLVKYHKAMCKDPTQRPQFNKFLKTCDKARENLRNLKHEELLISLYNNLFSGKEAMFTLIPALIANKQTKYFDTDKGFKVFLEMEEQAKKEYAEKMEKQRKTAEEVEKAKKEGKDVEMVFENGELKPFIVDAKENWK